MNSSETNFDTYIKELAFDIIKDTLSIKLSNEIEKRIGRDGDLREDRFIKVQLLFDGKMISEDRIEND